MQSKGEREKYNQLNAEFQRIARREKKAFFNEQSKEIEGEKEKKNRRKRLEIFSRKLEISKGNFKQKWAR